MLITFLPMNYTATVETAKNLLQIAEEMNINVNATCAGNGTCGKCKVIISKGNCFPYSEVEKRLLSKNELDRGVRLACQFEVTKDCCVILLNKQVEKINSVQCNSVSQDDYIGIAFDIGTTTVEGSAYSLTTKELLCNTIMDNPQRIFGADVISRITYIKNEPNGLAKLNRLIIDCCNQMISNMSSISGFQKEQVTSMSVAGNTIMSYIFMKEDTSCLIRAPFHLSYQGGGRIKAEELGLYCDCDVMLPRLIGGHVGSDTLGCVVETEIYKKEGIHLLVDIGTNGEIVLAKNGKLLACSTAAGPAFEGASIKHGMKAEKGAIYKTEVKVGAIIYKTIDNDPIKGICGSGLIDMIAELRKRDIIDITGRMEKDYIVSTNPEQVTLIQQDIREVQLAKAAIYAGIVLLLKHSNVELDEIDTLYIAGSFGSHLTVENAMYIGLLPKLPIERVHSIGNASLKGMSRLVKGELEFDEMNRIGQSIEHVELADNPEFNSVFLNWINFTD